MGQTIGLKGLDSITKRLKTGPKSDKAGSANSRVSAPRGGRPSSVKAGGAGGRRGVSKGSYTAARKSGTSRRQTGRV